MQIKTSLLTQHSVRESSLRGTAPLVSTSESTLTRSKVNPESFKTTVSTSSSDLARRSLGQQVETIKQTVQSSSSQQLQQKSSQLMSMDSVRQEFGRFTGVLALPDGSTGDSDVHSSVESLSQKSGYRQIQISELGGLQDTDKLTLVGHSDGKLFGGKSPEQVADLLESAGITSLHKISLKGCDSVDFARDLMQALLAKNPPIRVQSIAGRSGQVQISQKGHTLVDQSHQSQGHKQVFTLTEPRRGMDPYLGREVRKRDSRSQEIQQEGLSGPLGMGIPLLNEAKDLVAQGQLDQALLKLQDALRVASHPSNAAEMTQDVTAISRYLMGLGQNLGRVDLIVEGVTNLLQVDPATAAHDVFALCQQSSNPHVQQRYADVLIHILSRNPPLRDTYAVGVSDLLHKGLVTTLGDPPQVDKIQFAGKSLRLLQDLSACYGVPPAPLGALLRQSTQRMIQQSQKLWSHPSTTALDAYALVKNAQALWDELTDAKLADQLFEALLVPSQRLIASPAVAPVHKHQLYDQLLANLEDVATPELRQKTLKLVYQLAPQLLSTLDSLEPEPRRNVADSLMTACEQLLEHGQVKAASKLMTALAEQAPYETILSRGVAIFAGPNPDLARNLAGTLLQRVTQNPPRTLSQLQEQSESCLDAASAITSLDPALGIKLLTQGQERSLKLLQSDEDLEAKMILLDKVHNSLSALSQFSSQGVQEAGKLTLPMLKPIAEILKTLSPGEDQRELAEQALSFARLLLHADHPEPAQLAIRFSLQIAKQCEHDPEFVLQTASTLAPHAPEQAVQLFEKSFAHWQGILTHADTSPADRLKALQTLIQSVDVAYAIEPQFGQQKALDLYKKHLLPAIAKEPPLPLPLKNAFLEQTLSLGDQVLKQTGLDLAKEVFSGVLQHGASFDRFRHVVESLKAKDPAWVAGVVQAQLASIYQRLEDQSTLPPQKALAQANALALLKDLSDRPEPQIRDLCQTHCMRMAQLFNQDQAVITELRQVHLNAQNTAVPSPSPKAFSGTQLEQQYASELPKSPRLRVNVLKVLTQKLPSKPILEQRLLDLRQELLSKDVDYWKQNPQKMQELAQLNGKLLSIQSELDNLADLDATVKETDPMRTTIENIMTAELAPLKSAVVKMQEQIRLINQGMVGDIRPHVSRITDILTPKIQALHTHGTPITFTGSEKGEIQALLANIDMSMPQGDSKQFRVTFSLTKYPESSLHILQAWAAHAGDPLRVKNSGIAHPNILTVNRKNAKANRKASLEGVDPKGPQKLDRDEYPFAMTKQGGGSASIRYVSYLDNEGSGSFLGGKLRAKDPKRPGKMVVEDEEQFRMQIGI